jgi:hypothetical protein
MPPTRAFSVPKVQGEILYASDVNALDDQQFDRIARSGTTTLTAATVVDLAGFDFTFSTGGAGKFRPDADATQFGGTGFPGIPGRSLTNVVPAVTPIYDKTTTPIAFQESAEYIQQVDSTGPPVLSLWRTLPVGAVRTSLKFGLSKAASGTLPAVFPSAQLYRQELATSTTTTVGSAAVDAPADLAAYKAHHVLNVSLGLGHTIAAGYSYLLSITGDNTSTNISTGVRIYRPRADYAISTLRQI